MNETFWYKKIPTVGPGIFQNASSVEGADPRLVGADPMRLVGADPRLVGAEAWLDWVSKLDPANVTLKVRQFMSTGDNWVNYSFGVFCIFFSPLPPLRDQPAISMPILLTFPARN